MPIKTLLFLGGFVVCVVGALFEPLLGILGYMMTYCIGPERQWWERPIEFLGLRYSLTLAAATAIGIALHYRTLRYGKKLLAGQEKLLLAFLAVVWLSTLLGPPTEGRYTLVDHPSIKMTKILLFVMMLTHVVTTVKRVDAVMWVLVASSFIVGLQAYSTPYRQFVHGRLEQVGGADLSEANYFGAFCVAMLPLIGIQFLRSRWWGKAACLVAGAFTANAVVLTRSRGAVVGLGASLLVAAAYAPKQHRGKIIVGLVAALLGVLYLADPQFLGRATTITRGEEARDTSAQSRIVLWQAGGRMFLDHPQGIGAGNWYQQIGRYAPTLPGMDSHNTFVKCACELGVQGIALLLCVIGAAFLTLRKTGRRVQQMPPGARRDMLYLLLGLKASLAALLACCLTMTLLYVEVLWWLLALPVCLERVAANLEEELAAAPVPLLAADAPGAAPLPAGGA